MQENGPMLEYDKETGLVFLSAYQLRQIVFRVGEDRRIYLWWRRSVGDVDKGEYGFSPGVILEALAASPKSK